MFKTSILYICMIHLVRFSLQSPVTGSRHERQQSMIVIPYPQSGKPFQPLPSYEIDGSLIMQQFSLNAIVKALANVPELETLVDLLHDITVGDVYQTVFPKGIIYTFNEMVLKRFGLTTESLKKLSTVSGLEDETDGGLENVYDDVNEDGGGGVDSDEENSTDDYEDRFDGAGAGSEIANEESNTTARLVNDSVFASTEPPKNVWLNRPTPQYVDANVLFKEWLQKLG